MSTKKTNLWTGTFLLLMLINALNSMASFMINPILPTYLTERGLSFALTGLISSLMSWVALFFRPVSGYVSDKFDKRIAMLLAYVVTTSCMFVYYFSNNVVLSVITRIIHGISFAVSSTVSLSFATSFVPVEILAEGMGYLTLSNLVGQMFGPQLGSSIADKYGNSVPFMIAGFFLLAALVVIYILPYKKPEAKKEVRKLSLKLSDCFAVELIVYVVLIAIFSLGNGVVSYYLKTLGQERAIENFAIFFTVNSLAMLVAKPFFSKVHDKKGIQYVLYPAYILTAASMILIANAHSLLPLILAAICKACGQGCATTAIQAESVKKLGAERSGVAVSTCYIGQDLGNGIGPVVAGVVISASGYTTMFTLLGVCMLVGLVIYHFYYNSEKKKA